ncbi:hypothetical protein P280DRAFT_465162 [Massarina eburnea CBS 473.64]|uniref:DUF6536 domain-containing protein n=1 Tax=Massarina eburnea CBS 473.64 TaxID=1395130 RepID=A0A6A6SDG7_9PLEO|nr:hypothetical protein P280DRAFT_465162 [Massarina eburnea CBS 473.64]
MCIGAASLVLVLNITLLGVSMKWIQQEGIGTAFSGDCKITGRWNTAGYAIINLLSNILFQHRISVCSA